MHGGRSPRKPRPSRATIPQPRQARKISVSPSQRPIPVTVRRLNPTTHSLRPPAPDKSTTKRLAWSFLRQLSKCAFSTNSRPSSSNSSIHQATNSTNSQSSNSNEHRSHNSKSQHTTNSKHTSTSSSSHSSQSSSHPVQLAKPNLKLVQLAKPGVGLAKPKSSWRDNLNNSSSTTTTSSFQNIIQTTSPSVSGSTTAQTPISKPPPHRETLSSSHQSNDINDPYIQFHIHSDDPQSNARFREYRASFHALFPDPSSSPTSPSSTSPSPTSPSPSSPTISPDNVQFNHLSQLFGRVLFAPHFKLRNDLYRTPYLGNECTVAPHILRYTRESITNNEDYEQFVHGILVDVNQHCATMPPPQFDDPSIEIVSSSSSSQNADQPTIVPYWKHLSAQAQEQLHKNKLAAFIAPQPKKSFQSSQQLLQQLAPETYNTTSTEQYNTTQQSVDGGNNDDSKSSNGMFRDPSTLPLPILSHIAKSKLFLRGPYTFPNEFVGDQKAVFRRYIYPLFRAVVLMSEPSRHNNLVATSAHLSVYTSIFTYLASFPPYSLDVSMLTWLLHNMRSEGIYPNHEIICASLSILARSNSSISLIAVFEACLGLNSRAAKAVKAAFFPLPTSENDFTSFTESLEHAAKQSSTPASPAVSTFVASRKRLDKSLDSLRSLNATGSSTEHLSLSSSTAPSSSSSSSPETVEAPKNHLESFQNMLDNDQHHIHPYNSPSHDQSTSSTPSPSNSKSLSAAGLNDDSEFSQNLASALELTASSQHLHVLYDEYRYNVASIPFNVRKTAATKFTQQLSKPQPGANGLILPITLHNSLIDDAFQLSAPLISSLIDSLLAVGQSSSIGLFLDRLISHRHYPAEHTASLYHNAIKTFIARGTCSQTVTNYLDTLLLQSLPLTPNQTTELFTVFCDNATVIFRNAHAQTVLPTTGLDNDNDNKTNNHHNVHKNKHGSNNKTSNNNINNNNNNNNSTKNNNDLSNTSPLLQQTAPDAQKKLRLSLAIKSTHLTSSQQQTLHSIRSSHRADVLAKISRTFLPWSKGSVFAPLLVQNRLLYTKRDQSHISKLSTRASAKYPSLIAALAQPPTEHSRPLTRALRRGLTSLQPLKSILDENNVLDASKVARLGNTARAQANQGNAYFAGEESLGSDESGSEDDHMNSQLKHLDSTLSTEDVFANPFTWNVPRLVWTPPHDALATPTGNIASNTQLVISSDLGQSSEHFSITPLQINILSDIVGYLQRCIALLRLHNHSLDFQTITRLTKTLSEAGLHSEATRLVSLMLQQQFSRSFTSNRNENALNIRHHLHQLTTDTTSPIQKTHMAPHEHLMRSFLDDFVAATQLYDNDVVKNYEHAQQMALLIRDVDLLFYRSERKYQESLELFAQQRHQVTNDAEVVSKPSSTENTHHNNNDDDDDDDGAEIITPDSTHLAAEMSSELFNAAMEDEDVALLRDLQAQQSALEGGDANFSSEDTKPPSSSSSSKSGSKPRKASSLERLNETLDAGIRNRPLLTFIRHELASIDLHAQEEIDHFLQQETMQMEHMTTSSLEEICIDPQTNAIEPILLRSMNPTIFKQRESCINQILQRAFQAKLLFILSATKPTVLLAYPCPKPHDNGSNASTQSSTSASTSSSSSSTQSSSSTKLNIDRISLQDLETIRAQLLLFTISKRPSDTKTLPTSLFIQQQQINMLRSVAPDSILNSAVRTSYRHFPREKRPHHPYESLDAYLLQDANNSSRNEVIPAHSTSQILPLLYFTCGRDALNFIAQQAPQPVGLLDWTGISLPNADPINIISAFKHQKQQQFEAFRLFEMVLKHQRLQTIISNTTTYHIQYSSENVSSHDRILAEQQQQILSNSHESSSISTLGKPNTTSLILKTPIFSLSTPFRIAQTVFPSSQHHSKVLLGLSLDSTANHHSSTQIKHSDEFGTIHTLSSLHDLQIIADPILVKNVREHADLYNIDYDTCGLVYIDQNMLRSSFERQLYTIPRAIPAANANQVNSLRDSDLNHVSEHLYAYSLNDTTRPSHVQTLALIISPQQQSIESAGLSYHPAYSFLLRIMLSSDSNISYTSHILQSINRLLGNQTALPFPVDQISNTITSSDNNSLSSAQHHHHHHDSSSKEHHVLATTIQNRIHDVTKTPFFKKLSSDPSASENILGVVSTFALMLTSTESQRVLIDDNAIAHWQATIGHDFASNYHYRQQQQQQQGQHHGHAQLSNEMYFSRLIKTHATPVLSPDDQIVDTQSSTPSASYLSTAQLMGQQSTRDLLFCASSPHLSSSHQDTSPLITEDITSDNVSTSIGFYSGMSSPLSQLQSVLGQLALHLNPDESSLSSLSQHTSPEELIETIRHQLKEFPGMASLAQVLFQMVLSSSSGKHSATKQQNRSNITMDLFSLLFPQKLLGASDHHVPVIDAATRLRLAAIDPERAHLEIGQVIGPHSPAQLFIELVHDLSSTTALTTYQRFTSNILLQQSSQMQTNDNISPLDTGVWENHDDSDNDDHNNDKRMKSLQREHDTISQHVDAYFQQSQMDALAQLSEQFDLSFFIDSNFPVNEQEEVLYSHGFTLAKSILSYRTIQLVRELSNLTQQSTFLHAKAGGSGQYHQVANVGTKGLLELTYLCGLSPSHVVTATNADILHNLNNFAWLSPPSATSHHDVSNYGDDEQSIHQESPPSSHEQSLSHSEFPDNTTPAVYSSFPRIISLAPVQSITFDAVLRKIYHPSLPLLPAGNQSLSDTTDSQSAVPALPDSIFPPNVSRFFLQIVSGDVNQDLLRLRSPHLYVEYLRELHGYDSVTALGAIANSQNDNNSKPIACVRPIVTSRIRHMSLPSLMRSFTDTISLSGRDTPQVDPGAGEGYVNLSSCDIPESLQTAALSSGGRELLNMLHTSSLSSGSELINWYQSASLSSGQDVSHDHIMTLQSNGDQQTPIYTTLQLRKKASGGVTPHSLFASASTPRRGVVELVNLFSMLQSKQYDSMLPLDIRAELQNYLDHSSPTPSLATLPSSRRLSPQLALHEQHTDIFYNVPRLESSEMVSKFTFELTSTHASHLSQLLHHNSLEQQLLPCARFAAVDTLVHLLQTFRDDAEQGKTEISPSFRNDVESSANTAAAQITNISRGELNSNIDAVMFDLMDEQSSSSSSSSDGTAVAKQSLTTLQRQHLQPMAISAQAIYSLTRMGCLTTSYHMFRQLFAQADFQSLPKKTIVDCITNIIAAFTTRGAVDQVLDIFRYVLHTTPQASYTQSHDLIDNQAHLGARGKFDSIGIQYVIPVSGCISLLRSLKCAERGTVLDSCLDMLLYTRRAHQSLSSSILNETFALLEHHGFISEGLELFMTMVHPSYMQRLVIQPNNHDEPTPPTSQQPEIDTTHTATDATAPQATVRIHTDIYSLSPRFPLLTNIRMPIDVPVPDITAADVYNTSLPRPFRASAFIYAFVRLFRPALSTNQQEYHAQHASASKLLHHDALPQLNDDNLRFATPMPRVTTDTFSRALFLCATAPVPLAGVARAILRSLAPPSSYGEEYVLTQREVLLSSEIVRLETLRDRLMVILRANNNNNSHRNRSRDEFDPEILQEIESLVLSNYGRALPHDFRQDLSRETSPSIAHSKLTRVIGMYSSMLHSLRSQKILTPAQSKLNRLYDATIRILNGNREGEITTFNGHIFVNEDVANSFHWKTGPVPPASTPLSASPTTESNTQEFSPSLAQTDASYVFVLPNSALHVSEAHLSAMSSVFSNPQSKVGRVVDEVNHNSPASAAQILHGIKHTPPPLDFVESTKQPETVDLTLQHETQQPPQPDVNEIGHADDKPKYVKNEQQLLQQLSQSHSRGEPIAQLSSITQSLLPSLDSIEQHYVGSNISSLYLSNYKQRRDYIHALSRELLQQTPAYQSQHPETDYSLKILTAKNVDFNQLFSAPSRDFLRNSKQWSPSVLDQLYAYNYPTEWIHNRRRKSMQARSSSVSSLASLASAAATYHSSNGSKQPKAGKKHRRDANK